jgi:hypothetical protein
MQAPLFGLLDIAQDASTRTSRSVDGEKRRLLKALADKTARASAYILAHLEQHGATSGKALTDACKAAGIVPHNDKAFGPVFHQLSKRRQIVVTGYAKRAKGNGTGGGNVWGIA